MTSLKPQIILKPGREKSLRRRHPWMFSGAVVEVRGDPRPGATVTAAHEHDEIENAMNEIEAAGKKLGVI